ncbi:uncharacterized protein EDB91DRAFT_1238284 [Suillus paluster]|uniref:uncharacterized protein n=1 Tax=Suillus paluster TaxID=48578 RepID=UPI001B87D47A|nr:uncharacterized protein EDB91DRAFT_1238284 [Suillus paluster]KAG1735106.1 hypothetical protein EDB91DRAFT_1238284 [Suillus paluster]
MTQPLEYLSQAHIDKVMTGLLRYLVVRGFLSHDQTSSLLARSKDLLDEFTPEDHPLIKFTTSDKDHVGDDYFLNSGDKIRYFLDEDASRQDKAKAVNKIGHALHELDPVFRKVTLENDRLKALSQTGGAVPEHNDSALGFWMALEKCTPTNGALSFLPGSHLTTPITKRFVRLPGGGTGFEQLTAPPPPPSDTSEKTMQIASESASEGKYVLEACEPGDLVLIHGSVLHKSERNTSAHTRFAYTFHMIDSPPYAKHDEKNWLQPTEAMPFSRILDAPIGNTLSTPIY